MGEGLRKWFTFVIENWREMSGHHDAGYDFIIGWCYGMMIVGDPMISFRESPTNMAKSDPSEFFLGQNFPNPFNPSTTINFSLPEQSYVVIKVYDTIGQEIVTLVNEQKSAGCYSVGWNGKSQPSGLYFYRITAGSYKKTNKMMLIK